MQSSISDTLTLVNSAPRIFFLSASLNNRGMQKIEETRRARLRQLVADYGTQAKLSEKIGKAPAQISQWINASKDSKTGTPRVMDRTTAREIEKALKKPDGWMDQPPDEVAPEHAGTMSNVRRVTVVGTARLGENGFYEEISSIAGAGDGYIVHPTSDPNAYVLRVRGNSMTPAIRDGWYVLVEPNSAPAIGEYVMVKLTNGQKMVKELLIQRTGSIEIMSVNGDERRTIYDDEIEALHAVAAVVPPSRWKPD